MFNKIMEQFIELCEQFDGLKAAEGKYGDWTFELYITYEGDRAFHITKKKQKEVGDITEEEMKKSRDCCGDD